MPKKDPSPALQEPISVDPPAGGRWIRQPDGSLVPVPDEAPLPTAADPADL